MPSTPEQLVAAEDALFARWLKRTPTLLRDGALGGVRSTYLEQPVRVLFVLKEPNDTGGRWSARGADLRQHARDFAALRSTFPVLLLLTSLAQSFAAGTPSPHTFAETQALLRDPATRVEVLESIVLVNLKKTPGGPVADDRALAAAVRTDGDLLREQLALYRPSLTIAGGAAVFALLLQRFGSTSRSSPGTRPFFHHPELGLCLSFFHPQATKGYAFLHDLLRGNLLAHGFARLQ